MATNKNKPYVSPSPTRTSIKEANDHLQLLYQKVIELEKTVKDQAEALMRKDEYMQTKLKELAEAKDAEIDELQRKSQYQSQKIKKLESSLKEKEVQTDVLTERLNLMDEVVAYIPIIERLLSSLKKLPTTGNNAAGSNNNNVLKINSQPFSSRPKNRSSSRSHSKLRNSASGSNAQNSIANHDSNSAVDGHSVVSQISDLRIGRSFNINRNFSMSEDEGENGQV